MSQASVITNVVAALRGGRAVGVAGLTILSVETATDAMLNLLDLRGDATVLLSAERAAALGLGNRREVEPGRPVLVERCDWLDRLLVRALADPARDMDRIVPGPLAVTAPSDVEASTLR